MNGRIAALPTMTVMIASYRRTQDLARCLAALAAQGEAPEAVNVVYREEDRETAAFLADPAHRWPFALSRHAVDRPGVVAARNLGLDTTATEIVAIIDDDTEPYPDWTGRIRRHFAEDPRLGGLGGRDELYYGDQLVRGRADTVGKLQWFGRVIGNHHLGYGAARPADVLKGANMSFRMSALGLIRFDEDLRGDGAQPWEDIGFSLAVQRAGWRIVYDPAVLVRHNQSARVEARHYATMQAVTGRERHNYTAFCYNEVLALWPSLSWGGRIAYVLFSAIVGTGLAPGLVQIARHFRSLRLGAVDRFLLCQAGKFQALRKVLTGSRAQPGT